MPLITASHDSLPYIDPPPPTTGPHSLSAATTLINSLLPPSHTTTPHPSLPPLREPNLTPLASSEQSRIARSEPLTAIDLSRYEPPSPPSSTNHEAKLHQAQTTSTYLRLRHQHLSLSEKHAKNAWLIGNSQLEEMLRGVERELAGCRENVEGVNRDRKGMQENRRGEMEGLERGWREGVGRVVEVEIAVGGMEGERRGRLREGGG
ncbi:MAG: hypothetical protein Q9209_000524 [Squamulea sp. 1 TL-2023]